MEGQREGGGCSGGLLRSVLVAASQLCPAASSGHCWQDGAFNSVRPRGACLHNRM